MTSVERAGNEFSHATNLAAVSRLGQVQKPRERVTAGGGGRGKRAISWTERAVAFNQGESLVCVWDAFVLKRLCHLVLRHP
jgi:hypothetical protein